MINEIKTTKDEEEATIMTSMTLNPKNCWNWKRIKYKYKKKR